MTPAVRRLTGNDLAAVQRVLYLAVAWNEPEGLPEQDVAMQHPAMQLYHEGWGRPGDDGCVAEVDGEFVGGAYYRLFTEDHHGDGFLAPDVPELAVAVEVGFRGLGLGRRLMQELASIATRNGIERLSLSVHKPNPALGLYSALGFRIAEDHGESVLMVQELDPA